MRNIADIQDVLSAKCWPFEVKIFGNKEGDPLPVAFFECPGQDLNLSNYPFTRSKTAV
jgi:hypothetical protein